MKLRFNRILVQIGLLILLIFALYVSFWREGLRILPELEYMLTDAVSEALATDVEFTGTRGYFTGLQPHIRVQQFKVMHPIDRTTLVQLDDVQFSLRFWDSLWQQQLVFDSIAVRRGQVNLRQRGPLEAQILRQTFNWQSWLQFALSQKNLTIDQFDLTLAEHAIRLNNILYRDVDLAALLKSPAQALLGNKGLQADIAIESQGHIIAGQLHARFQDPLLGDPEVTALYVNLQGNPALAALAMANAAPARRKSLVPLVAGLQFKLEFEQNWPSQFYLQATSVTTPAPALHLNLHGQLTKDRWQGAGRLGQGFIQSSLYLSAPASHDLQTLLSSRLYVPQLPASQLTSLAHLLKPDLPDDLNLSGEVNRVVLSRDFLAAQFEHFAINGTDWRLGPVNAAIVGQPQAGLIRLQDSLVNIQLPKLLRQELQGLELNASTLFWQTQQGDWRLQLPELSIRHEDASAVLTARISRQLNDRPLLELLGEVQSSSPNEYQRYLPAFLKAGLTSWLDSAIEAGQLTGGRFLFHGPARRRQADPRLQPDLQLQFSGQDLTLAYHQAWPKLTNATADVFLGKGRVDFSVTSGASLGLAAQGKGQVILPKDKTQAPELSLALNASGHLPDGVQFLQRSPLAQRLQAVFPVIETSGHFSSDVKLALHLGQQQSAPKVQVATQLDQAQVLIKPARLQLEQVNGQVDFSSSDGLSASQLTARVFDQPFKFQVQSQNRRTAMDFTGVVAAEQLAPWLEQPILQQLVGETPVQGQVNLPWDGKPVALNIESNLLGLTIKLPAPLGKLAAQRRNWQLRGLFDQRAAFDIHDENYYGVRFDLKDGQLAGLDAIIGDTQTKNGRKPLSYKVAPGQRWTVDVDRFDALQWSRLWQQLQRQAGAKSQTHAQSKQKGQTGQPLQRLQLSVQDLQLAQTSFGPLRISANQEPGGWRAQWDGQSFQGEGFVPRTASNIKKSTPLRLAFSELRLQRALWRKLQGRRATGSTFTQGASLETSLSRLPPVSLKIDELYLDEDFIGRLEISGQPAINGYTWHSMYGQTLGLHWRGQGDFDQKLGSAFQFDVRGGRLDRLYGLLHDLELVTEEQAPISPASVSGSFALNWPGVVPAFANLSGQGEMSMEDGVIKGVNGVAPIRWLSLISAERFARRLRFDFTDLAEQGLAFDRLLVSGVLNKKRLSDTRFMLESPSLQLESTGWVDFGTGTLSQQCVAIIPVMDHLLLPAVAAGGLPAAATAFMLDKALGDQLNQLTKLEWQVEGALAAPSVQPR